MVSEIRRLGKGTIIVAVGYMVEVRAEVVKEVNDRMREVQTLDQRPYATVVFQALQDNT